MRRMNLRAANGQYLGVDICGSTEVWADRDGVGSWEIFSLIRVVSDEGILRSGDRIGLRSAEGRYPVVISAVASHLPPNQMLSSTTFSPLAAPC